MADHVTIDGADYCLTGSGLAVRVTLEVAGAPGGVLDLADDVIRATWDIGGTWDAGRNPWFVPTPNPLEVELATDDPRWDPLNAGFWNPVPLQSVMTVWLAEDDTDPAGAWFVARRARGMILGWTIEPGVGGMKSRVVLSAVDSTTSMADASIGERVEEDALTRLTYLAGLTAGLSPAGIAVGGGGPIMGRVHPSQDKNALDHAVDVALARGHALIFQPFYTADPKIHTLVSSVPIAVLGAPGLTFTASTDPDAGAVNPGAGSSQALAPNGVPACLDSVEFTKTDDGFRTRIDASREVAYWLLNQTNLSSAGINVPPGTYTNLTGSVPYEIDDQWELTWEAGVNFTGTPNIVPFVWNGSMGSAVYESARGPVYTGQGWSLVYRVKSTWAHSNNEIAWQTYIPGGAIWNTTWGEARVERLDGNGPVATYVAPGADETNNGVRALVGHRSPLARQADLVTWLGQALAWRTTPRKQNASPVRVRSTAGHPSPGTRQWAVHLNPSVRVALAMNTIGTPPFPASVAVWVVALKFTLEPDAVTLDVTCAPPSDPY